MKRIFFLVFATFFGLAVLAGLLLYQRDKATMTVITFGALTREELPVLPKGNVFELFNTF